ncbi:hypothetical protein GW17_00061316 [Ensete ventricosum]|nr:hypothetical protein GW17_00061316 [Ensete ventricosum]
MGGSPAIWAVYLLTPTGRHPDYMVRAVQPWLTDRTPAGLSSNNLSTRLSSRHTPYWVGQLGFPLLRSAIEPLSRLMFLLRQVGYRRNKGIILLRQASL